MNLTKTLSGILLCIVLTIVGCYRLFYESLNTYTYVMSIILILVCPIAIVIMTFKIIKAKRERDLF